MREPRRVDVAGTYARLGVRPSPEGPRSARLGPPRSTLAKLRARCAELGVEFAHEVFDFEALCPRGRRFVSTGTHMLRVPGGPRGYPSPEAYGCLLDDLAMGVEPCPDAAAGCDYCDEADA